MTRDGCGNGVAVIDTSLDFASLFVIVPGGHAQPFQWPAGIKKTGDQFRGIQQCAPALLSGHAIRSPAGVVVIESFLDRTNRNSVGMGNRILVEVLVI